MLFLGLELSSHPILPSHLSTNLTSLRVVGFVEVQPAQLHRTPHLTECSAVAILKFLIILEQEALHFHVALGPANYEASLALREPSLIVQMPLHNPSQYHVPALLCHLLQSTFLH